MNKQTKGELMSLVSDIDSPEYKKEIQDVRNIDYKDELFRTLTNFFVSQTKILEEEDLFKNKVVKYLSSKMENNELTVPQAISLYRTIRTENSDASRNILSVAIPNREGKVSPLVRDTEKEEENSAEAGMKDFLQNLSSQDNEAISKLFKAYKEVEDIGE